MFVPTGIFLLLGSNIFSVEPALPVTLSVTRCSLKKGEFLVNMNAICH